MFDLLALFPSFLPSGQHLLHTRPSALVVVHRHPVGQHSRHGGINALKKEADSNTEMDNETYKNGKKNHKKNHKGLDAQKHFHRLSYYDWLWWLWIYFLTPFSLFCLIF
jgi:hypothetical protein